MIITGIRLAESRRRGHRNNSSCVEGRVDGVANTSLPHRSGEFRAKFDVNDVRVVT